MNLFEFLKHYKDPSANQSYGDILNGGQSITENMNYIESAVYNQLKNSDRTRLINSGRTQNGH